MKNERRPVNPIAQQLGQAMMEGAGENYPTKYAITLEWSRQTDISQPHAYRIINGQRVPTIERFQSFVSVFEPNGDNYRKMASFFTMLLEDGDVSLNEKSPSPSAKENLRRAQQERRAREKAQRDGVAMEVNTGYPVAS